MKLDRRRFGWTAAALAASSAAGISAHPPRHSVSYRKPQSRVAILEADEYSSKLDDLIFQGLQLFRLNLTGKSVLLKPNFVEDLPGPVNTNPALVGAAARSFLRFGAARVVVGEGPGNQRDTERILQASGLAAQLRDAGVQFVDLNRDELHRVKLKASYSGLEELWLPRTVLAADFIVSMPKVKTHHWAGVTLSLKNMFGIVPGMKYGWPKNLLHWHGIHECILDLCATVPPHFVIADGIVAMEGNGPLQGTPRQLNNIVVADDPVAADATCARLMGFDPNQVRHIAEAAIFLGNMQPKNISLLAGDIDAPRQPFDVLPGFRYLLVTRGT
jgi:uncharacterized protein (DUF362 family)